ncbi:MAG: von Willebrand factor type A domain-containing protein, partial [Thermonemataceae bacterium]|nr:von Willebrand factor type A domain-containing protein [Thermonemataceae bacterium]
MKTKFDFRAMGLAGLLLASLFLNNACSGQKDGSSEKLAHKTDAGSRSPERELNAAKMEEAPPTDEPIHNTNEYQKITDNTFKEAMAEPLSTFSIDVDNASYSQVRLAIEGGTLPQPDMVRIEEMVNYFDYNYPEPKDNQPFSIYTELASCPWKPEHQLLHIGLQGKKMDYENLKPSNLVFLIDVSGSMEAENKLPLVKKSLKMLLE